ncbi:2',5'-phosphodiesterase 12 [Tetranychus urticae]|uniref:Endonuclease/exonuclease/phosphatase domain-containing protein n=1 Tax=Tetranychus urticae TaxID=32264 RepID=T1L371_TETUR|nr:2',5'-phosphodiesterase 12 [Tetranychus urticae]
MKIAFRLFKCELVLGKFIRMSSTCSDHSPSSGSTALLQMDSESDKISLQFTYRRNSTEKLFSLYRSKDETLSVAFSRLRLNLDKFINPNAKRTKWTKQAKKVKPDPSTLIDDQASPDGLIEIKLYNEGKLVDANTPHYQAWSDNSILMVGDQSYKILLNSPTVETLKLSNKLLTNFMVYPVIGLKYATIDDCAFSWYRVKSSNKEFISNCYIYYPTEQDLDHQLMVKVTPKDGKSVGLENSFISEDLVEHGPTDCPFQDRHKLTSTKTNPGSFRIVTYNILADYYTSMKTTPTEIFPYCAPEFLKFSYRKPLLLQEIIGYNADIICLQEVDRKFFANELTHVLCQFDDMEGFFIRKAGREIQVPEGVVIYFRKSKFKRLEDSSHDLTDLCLNDKNLDHFAKAVQRNNKLVERLSDRNTIVQYVLLESFDIPGKGLLIVNTHLYSNPDADHIRLLQGAIIVVHIENMIREYSLKYPHLKISPIFTGDFNSDPANGVYKLYTNGYIGSDYIDWKSVADEAIEGLEVKHSLKLTSAYGAPEFTNFTVNYVGCLDYIFFDNQSIEIDSLVPLPSRDIVSAHKAIPSSVFPSDHLALVTVLKWK